MKTTISNFSILFLFLFSFTTIKAQTIQFQNPSFEGTQGSPNVTPPMWDICQPGTTPDTQPGCWGITLPSSDGNSYIGLVDQASAGWHEGASQQLSSPLVPGTSYAFNIDIATTSSTQGGIIPGCVELQVYANMGGNTGCDMSNLVWSSGDVFDAAHMDQWVTHNVSFTATQPWTNILFQIHNLGCTDLPYLMLDNISGQPSVVIANHNMTICNNTATISAGPGYNAYLWSTGATTQSTTITSSGTYYVTATYNNHDTTDYVNVTLTQPYLNLDLGNDTTICGSANLALNAGSGFANYLWNTGSNIQSINVQQTGIYNVYTIDTANCSYYDTIKIIINPAQSLNLGNDMAFCNSHPYSLDAGIAFDSFVWSTAETTQSISVDSTGTYYVTATNNQCSATAIDSIHLIFNNIPVAEAGANDTICSGGSIVLNATGGNTYLWSSPSSLSCQNCANPIATPVHTTTYIVTVTNSTGCSATDNVTINVASAYFSATYPYCNQSNGTLTIHASGGSANYSYLWNTTPPQNGQALANLPSGMYTVTVTDNVVNCSFALTDTLANLAGPSVNVTNVVNATCGMNNGAINVSVTGAAPPYTGVWNSIPPQTTINLSNVPPGYYCLTITDANSCTATVCDTINALAFSAPDICMVTVDTASNHNLIVWEKPVTTGIGNYLIFRETNMSGIYNLIGTQNYSDFSTFIDTTSNPLQQSYRYKLAIQDNCGMTSQQSTFHQTLHLTINAGMGGAWNLIWNDYLGFAFSTYNIYRGTIAGNLSLINSVSSNVTSYTDLTPPPGVMYYMIEVVRPTPCNPSAKGMNSFSSSISNVASSSGNGIAEFDINNIVHIYPNPGNGVFTISFIDKAFKSAEVIITNAPGQQIYGTIQTKPSENIDISGYSKGIYLLAIKINDRIYYKKLMLQ